MWEGHLPVLVYPYKMPLQRDPVLFRGKPAVPFETRRKDQSIELTKYVQAKDSGTHIMFGPSLLDPAALRDVKIPVVITEGEKKMLAAESAGISAIALPGVTQWHVKGERSLHPYFVHLALREREVMLCFDCDALSNKDVRKQELAFGRALQAIGARVYIVRFPPSAPKLDDFLATHELSELHDLFDDARKNGQLPPDTTMAGASDENWAPVLPKLRRDAESNLPIKDVDNIARVLMLHPAWAGVLAFDARRERQIFQLVPPFADDMAVERATVPRPLIDSDVTRVGDWLVAQGCLGWATQPQPSQLERAIALTCERNRIERVRDYLIALVWDQVPRLDTMAPVYFGAKDTTYTRTVVAKWMLSAVARVRTPGCQVDHVLVLEGKQGIGKSTALRTLAGDDNFSDSLPDITTKDALEHCIGPWIIELAELDHMKKSEVSTLKAFVSQRAPAFRSAYAHRTMEHPRRCVFAASTNESSYLVDPTGGRRFWPIECLRIDTDGLARDRDQLWAEALHRVRAGESWHITDPEVRAQAEEEQADRRQVDPWHEVVGPFLKTRKVVTIGDVLDHLGFGPEETVPSSFSSYVRPASTSTRKGWKYDQRSSNRVSAILRELGWVRRQVRIGGERVWKYVLDDPPGTTSGNTGDIVGTAQLFDIKGKSPVSPVSPLDPYGVTSDLSPSLNSSSSLKNSGDTGDSNDKAVNPDTCAVTTASPVDPPTGDAADPRPRRRL